MKKSIGWVLTLAAVLALAGPGCKKHGKGDGSGGGGGGASAAAGPAFAIDGKTIPLDAATVAQWPALTTITPQEARDLARWTTIELKGAGGRSLKLPDIATAYPGLVPAVFPGADGISFGLFTPDALAKHGAPTLVEPGITRVEVTLADAAAAGSGGSGDGGGGGQHESGSAAIDYDALKLTIKAKGKDQVVTATEIMKLAKIAPPTGDTDTQGYDLLAVLGSVGLKPTAKMTLSDDSGASLGVTDQDVDPATGVAFIKLNHQGQIRFRLFKKLNGGWETAGELRGLNLIVLQ